VVRDHDKHAVSDLRAVNALLIFGDDSGRTSAGFLRIAQYPQGQGFMAAINWKFAEKVNEPLARLMVTTLSFIDWRITSGMREPNSGNSSKNKTPL
jgi:hypothetical protein